MNIHELLNTLNAKKTCGWDPDNLTFINGEGSAVDVPERRPDRRKNYESLNHENPLNHESLNHECLNQHHHHKGLNSEEEVKNSASEADPLESFVDPLGSFAKNCGINLQISHEERADLEKDPDSFGEKEKQIFGAEQIFGGNIFGAPPPGL